MIPLDLTSSGALVSPIPIIITSLRTTFFLHRILRYPNPLLDNHTYIPPTSLSLISNNQHYIFTYSTPTHFFPYPHSDPPTMAFNISLPLTKHLNLPCTPCLRYTAATIDGKKILSFHPSFGTEKIHALGAGRLCYVSNGLGRS